MPVTDVQLRTVAMALLVVSPMALAATDDGDEPGSTSPPASTEQSQTPPAPSGSARQAPASTFTPSEQIKADSSVPFPVDI
jgi:hypothetical protein